MVVMKSYLVLSVLALGVVSGACGEDDATTRDAGGAPDETCGDSHAVNPCLLPCETSAALACMRGNATSYDAAVAERRAAIAKYGCDDGKSTILRLQTGRCADGKRFQYDMTAFESAVRYFSADTGEQVAIYIQSDGLDPECTGASYWPERLVACESPTFDAPICGPVTSSLPQPPPRRCR